MTPTSISFIEGSLIIQDIIEDQPNIIYEFSNDLFRESDLIKILKILNINKNDIIHLNILLTSVLNIGNNLCYNFKNLEYVYLQNTLEIRHYSFENCKSLFTLQGLNNITYIGNSAFRNCTLLQILERLDNVVYIETSAFENCTSLESLQGLNKLSYIKFGVFNNCLSLRSLQGLDNITSIGTNARTSLRDVRLLG